MVSATAPGQLPWSPRVFSLAHEDDDECRARKALLLAVQHPLLSSGVTGHWGSAKTGAARASCCEDSGGTVQTGGSGDPTNWDRLAKQHLQQGALSSGTPDWTHKHRALQSLKAQQSLQVGGAGASSKGTEVPQARTLSCLHVFGTIHSSYRKSDQEVEQG